MKKSLIALAILVASDNRYYREAAAIMPSTLGFQTDCIKSDASEDAPSRMGISTSFQLFCKLIYGFSFFFFSAATSVICKLFIQRKKCISNKSPSLRPLRNEPLNFHIQDWSAIGARKFFFKGHSCFILSSNLR